MAKLLMHKGCHIKCEYNQDRSSIVSKYQSS